MQVGIYQIRNIANGKRYVGSSIDLSTRWKKHINKLKNNKHHSILLQRAWDKYSEALFVFEILELVSRGNLTKKEFRAPLLAREQHYKDLYKSYDPEYGYDICKIAGNTLGCSWKLSEETKIKMSEARMGNKNPNFGGNKGNKNPMFGKCQSDRSKRKNRETQIKNGKNSGKNNPMSHENRVKRANA